MRPTLLAALAAALAGCGGSHDSPSATAIQASCTGLPTYFFCDDVAGLRAGDLSAWKAACQATGYTPGDAPCQVNGRIGTCTRVFPPAETGYATAMTIYERTYFPLNRAIVADSCAAVGGSFTPN